MEIGKFILNATLFVVGVVFMLTLFALSSHIFVIVPTATAYKSAWFDCVSNTNLSYSGVVNGIQFSCSCVRDQFYNSTAKTNYAEYYEGCR